MSPTSVPTNTSQLRHSLHPPVRSLLVGMEGECADIGQEHRIFLLGELGVRYSEQKAEKESCDAHGERLE